MENKVVRGHISIMPLVANSPYPVFDAWDHASLVAAIGGAGDGNRVVNVIDNIDLTATITISGNRNVIIVSENTDLADFSFTGTPFTITHTGAPLPQTTFSDVRHFIVSTGTTLTLSHITIDGGSPSADFHRGGVTVSGQLFLRDGGIITNSRGQNGGGVTVSSGTFHMTGGEVRDNGAQVGGGVHITGSIGRFVMTGGQIHSNTAAGGGGGVSMSSLGNFTMDGGEIHGNTANRGGGVNVLTGGGTFIMNGGQIHGNNAILHNGGGVLLELNAAASFIMNGGIIGALPDSTDAEILAQRNTAAQNGGGVHVGNLGQLHLRGGTINGNTAGINGGGISIAGTGQLHTNPALITAPINITGNTAGGNGGGVWMGSTAAAVSNTLNVTSLITISNNTASNGGGVFMNTGSSHLRMTGGIISNNTADNDGGGIHAGAGQVHLLSGTIADNQATTGSGGGINIVGAANSQLHTNQINAPVYIINNTAGTYGGGVFMGSAALAANNAFHVTNFVTISNNTAFNGGGIYMNQANARVNMTGGEISNNTASNDGGGVLVRTAGSTSFTMTGGEISNNTAVTNNGGGIWIGYPSRTTGLNIGPNAVFSGNSAGGGIFDYGLALGQTTFPNIEWSTPNSVPVPAPNAHLLNNFDINNNLGAGPFWLVTFNLNGGNAGGILTDIVHKIEDGEEIGNATTVPAPTLQGYIFAGWQEVDALGDPVGNVLSLAAVAGIAVDNDLTFVAVWTPAGGGGGGNGTGNATILDPPTVVIPPVPPEPPKPPVIPEPPEPVIPVTVILLSMIGIAVFAYRKVEEAKEKENS